MTEAKMARFNFPLQNILNMKEKLEDQAKNEYSQANLRLRDAEEEMERLKKRQSDAEQELKVKLSEALDVRQIRQEEDGIEILKSFVERQQLVVLQRRRELEIARDKLNEAMKERKTFEKLREHAFEDFLKEQNLAEQKEIDELVSYRHGRV
ncbi:MAG TPA: flagellar export protein FliJ [Lachnospiraceae bacterium]|nr:flagellar export protein FliJ [Lachnospiraceae bacterium]